MIASKMACDAPYSNRSWCVVAQNMFSLEELNEMEREMCGYLDWNLVSFPLRLALHKRLKQTGDASVLSVDFASYQNVTSDQVDEFEQMLIRDHRVVPGG
jgi:hypothetical protein